MTNLVDFVNNINKRLNGLVNRITKRAVRVNKPINKSNNARPTRNACHSEFGTGEKLKNTLQALQKANSKNDRDKFKRATACLSYNNIGNTGQQLLLENSKNKTLLLENYKNKATTNGKVSDNVNPSQQECIDEFKTGDQLKNTLQALKDANDPKERSKLLKAKACLAYKNNMKNTSGTLTTRNNRNTVGNHLGNNTKKNANAKGYYKILGFNPPYDTITAKEITAAWRKLALKAHPNKGGDEAKFKLAKEAFEYLKDPDNRSLYNGKKPQLSLTAEKQLLLKNNNVNSKHWTKYSDEKESWYTNKKNPISVWEKNLPKNAIVDEAPPDFWVIGESDDRSWLKLIDTYGHTTFYNKADNQASWESPVGVEIKDLAVRRRVLSENVKQPDPAK